MRAWQIRRTKFEASNEERNSKYEIRNEGNATQPGRELEGSAFLRFVLGISYFVLHSRLRGFVLRISWLTISASRCHSRHGPSSRPHRNQKHNEATKPIIGIRADRRHRRRRMPEFAVD